MLRTEPEGVSASLMLPGLGCLAERGGEGLEFSLYVVA